MIEFFFFFFYFLITYEVWKKRKCRNRKIEKKRISTTDEFPSFLCHRTWKKGKKLDSCPSESEHSIFRAFYSLLLNINANFKIKKLKFKIAKVTFNIWNPKIKIYDPKIGIRNF